MDQYQEAAERLEAKTESAAAPKTPFEQFLEHQQKALEETGKALEALLPEGFRTHGKEASREFAKGMKVLVDATVAEMERVSKEVEKAFKERQNQPDPDAKVETTEAPSTTGRVKVKVQVD